MSHQDAVFRWIATEPGSLGLLLFALGGVYAFVGFRFHRALLALSCGFFGWIVGALFASVIGQPIGIPGLVGFGMGAVIGGGVPKAASAVVNGVVWAGLGAYLLDQFGFEQTWLLAGGAVAGGLGASFAALCQRTTPVVVTTLQGVVLLVVGLVGFTSDYFPTFGDTFRGWAASWSLLVPILMVMFAVTAYSYQELHRVGNTKTGASV